eukprot:gene23405-43980_t
MVIGLCAAPTLQGFLTGDIGICMCVPAGNFWSYSGGSRLFHRHLRAEAATVPDGPRLVDIDCAERVATLRVNGDDVCVWEQLPADHPVHFCASFHSPDGALRIL